MDEDITPEWTEKIIKKCSWLSSSSDPVERVLDIKVEDAIPKGFNYAGRLLRVMINLIYKSGRTDKLSVVIKSTPLSEDQHSFISEYKLFETETWTYDEILSRMEKLLIDSGVTGELDWPKHFTINKQNLLLLQDLKELGYSTVKQREATYEEGLLVVQAIGRFHALSIMLINQNAIDLSKFNMNNMAENNAIIQFVYVSSLRAIIDSIRSTKLEEWYSQANLIESNLEKIGPALKQVVKSSLGSDNVLNHGDCWLNNVMFKYSKQTGQPQAIKLIDFQIGYYNSLAWDLVHFIYCSYLTDTREKLKSSLISEYRTSLLKMLKQLNGFNLLHKVPTEDEVLKSMEKLSLFGTMVSLATTPRMIPNISSSLDLDITLPDEAYKAKTALYSIPHVFNLITKDLEKLCHIFRSL